MLNRTTKNPKKNIIVISVYALSFVSEPINIQ